MENSFGKMEIPFSQQQQQQQHKSVKAFLLTPSPLFLSSCCCLSLFLLTKYFSIRFNAAAAAVAR